MAKILIGAMGTTIFEGAVYDFSTGGSHLSNYFLHALSEEIHPDKVIVLLTKDARAKNLEGKDSLRAWIKNAELVPVDIEKGSNQEEAWKIFDAIADSVPEKAELYVDVTNGFRSIPILLLSAVQYLQKAKRVQIRDIYYCAADAVGREVLEKPVYPLGLFQTLLDWANAVDSFSRTGNSVQLADLLENELTGVKFTNRLALAKELRYLSLALDLVRPEEVLKSSARLVRELDKVAEQQTALEDKPFVILLNRIRDDFKPFAMEDTRNAPRTEIFLNKTFSLVEWYLQKERLSDALLLVREWMLTRMMWKDGIVGSKLYVYEERKEYETELGDMKRSESETGDIWKKLGKLRNNQAHAGFAERPIPISDMKADAEQIIRDIRKWAQRPS